VRLDSARTTPGTGIGLSLAAAVARGHGGEIHLRDNAPGLKVVIRLPTDVDDRTVLSNKAHPELPANHRSHAALGCKQPSTISP
jgi:hypothetical protein